MRAAIIVPGSQGGRVEIQEVQVPAPSAGRLQIRVMASGLNRGEINQVRNARSGDPFTAGVEFAGVVSRLGTGVTRFRVGDPVAGHGIGGQAEFVVADERAVMPMPAGLTWLEAAAFPNVFITAHDALVVNGELREGETVLVNAGSSGIGLAAIQLATQMGARSVLASTRSAEKAARLLGYGVERVIDLSRDPLVPAVMDSTGGRGVDIVIDSVGASMFESHMKSLAVKGRLVNIGRMGGASTQFDLNDLWLKRLKLIGVTFRTRTEEERLACIEACACDVLPLLGAGRIKLPVHQVYPLEHLAHAHVAMEKNQHFGKIVIAVDRASASTIRTASDPGPTAVL